MLRYSGFDRISSRVRSSGACSRMRESQDSLVSSIAAHSSPLGFTPGGEEGLVGHAPLGVADPFEPQGVGQSAGGVDGEHEHLAAEMRGGHGRSRGRGRRLAHPPGPARHHDLLRRQEAVERRPARVGLARDRAWPSGGQLLAEGHAPPGGACAARADG